MSLASRKNKTSKHPVPEGTGDYITTSEWSRESLAFCYKEDILNKEDLNSPDNAY